MSERTPLHIVGGSLGSGKTTLLRHLLSGEHGRLAVMINEFGDIGLDADTLPGRDIELMELAGGCVCCSLAGEFAAGVRELIDRVDPEAIVVETTGVAEADALVEDIQDDLPEARLESVVILVDADAVTRFPELGFVERTQLKMADLILINKTDLVAATALNEVRDRVAAINPDARRMETTQARIDPALILASPHPHPRPQRIGVPPVEDHGMQSFSWRPDFNLNRACFERALADWPEAIYRAKGRLTLDGDTWLFNYVAGRWQLDPIPEAEPALVWIGPGIAQYRQSMLNTLEACRED